MLSSLDLMVRVIRVTDEKNNIRFILEKATQGMLKKLLSGYLKN